MASRRAARIAERIREEASRIILYELHDPRIGLVTVTKVDLSSDYLQERVLPGKAFELLDLAGSKAATAEAGAEGGGAVS